MLNIALIGCGGMANWHASEWVKLAPEAQVVALVDPVPAQTAAFQQKYFPNARIYASMGDLLADPPAGLNAVNLVTPHTQHFEQAQAALQAGWHVLVEKPMVTASEHAYALAALVRKTGLKLGITYQSPYTAEFGYLAAMRDAGELGRVQIISGQLSQDWLRGTAGKWRQDPALSGGGQMYDSGAHLLNAIMWLMNEPVVQVSCMYDRCGSAVDINGVAIARFRSGAFASLAIGGNCPQFQSEVQIQTERYLVLTDQYGGKLELRRGKLGRCYPHVPNADSPAAGSPHHNFLRATQGLEPLRAPVRYGVLLSALMDALYKAAETGQVVDVVPVPDDL